MLTVTNLYKRYGPVRALSGVSFSIAQGQKMALVGPNGVGKSTLLRIIAGLETEDKGSVVRNRRILTGYLPQEVMPVSKQETVFGYFRRVGNVTSIESRMGELEGSLGDEEKLCEFGELQEEYERLGGYDFDRRARRVLDGLGLSEVGLERPVSELSGGERRRVALGAALVGGADLLLLDEPTNDLDLEAIFFLESYVRGSDAAVIVASHDRTFLDSVVHKVLELDWYYRTAELYSGNWSAYRAEKIDRDRRALELHDRAEDERYRLRGTAEEKNAWAKIGAEQKMPDKDKMSQGFHRNRAERKFHAAAKALVTRAGKVTDVRVPKLREELELIFTPVDGVDRGIVTRGLVAGYEGGFRIGPIDLELPYGVRAGLFGRNASGKSTVLRAIAGRIEAIEGEVVRGAQTLVGFLTQDCDIVPKRETATEWFARSSPIRESDELHAYLGRFLLEPGAADFRLGELSPGERMRMALAYLMATGVNTLLLDEPTNHLDLEAIEALETALDLYQGTLVLVSHDRMFLDRVRLDRVFAIGGGRMESYADYRSYLDAATASASEGMKALRI